MAGISIKKTKEAMDILEHYAGQNDYIKLLKYYTYTAQTKVPNDFELQYIIQNKDFIPVEINKIVKVVEWWGEKKREEYNYQYPITKLKIVKLIGETDTTYYVSLLYKQNQEKPVNCFIPKSVLLDSIEPEKEDKYTYDNVDFDMYDKMLEPYNIKILNIQKETALFMLNKCKMIAANQPGTGKSMATILACKIADFKKILILCPATLKQNWKSELIRLEKEEDITIIEGLDSKNKAELESFLGYKEGESILKASEMLAIAKQKGSWVNNKKYTIVNYDIIDDFHNVPKTVNNNGKVVKTRNKSEIVHKSAYGTS